MKWSNSELISFLAKNWANADSIQGNRNRDILWQMKKSEMKDRESINPSNKLKVETDEFLEIFGNKPDNSIGLSDTLRIARHKKAPPIILDNMIEVDTSHTNPACNA